MTGVFIKGEIWTETDTQEGHMRLKFYCHNPEAERPGTLRFLVTSKEA